MRKADNFVIYGVQLAPFFFVAAANILFVFHILTLVAMLSVSLYNSNFFDEHCIMAKAGFEEARRHIMIYQIFHALLKHYIRNLLASSKEHIFTI